MAKKAKEDQKKPTGQSKLNLSNGTNGTNGVNGAARAVPAAAAAAAASDITHVADVEAMDVDRDELANESASQSAS